jgi:hypothetical protein
MSIPLLSSTMERVISCVNLVFPPTAEIDLQNVNTRSNFFLCMKSLLSDSPGAPLTREFRQSFNIPMDIALNVGVSFLMEPHASGDFGTSPPGDLSGTNTDEGSSRGGDESATEPSTTDMSAPSESQSLFAPLPLADKPSVGKLRVKLVQNATFRVIEGQTADEIECDGEVFIAASAGKGTGALQFALIPANILTQVRVNANIVTEESGVYTVERPAQIEEMTKLLVFDAKVAQEPAPFQVNCNFESPSGRATIRITIEASLDMYGILVGLDSTGMESPTCSGGELTQAGANLLVKVDEIRDRGKATVSISGAVGLTYQPPAVVQVRATVKGFSFGGITARTAPDGKYTIESIVTETFVSRSVWPLSR